MENQVNNIDVIVAKPKRKYVRKTKEQIEEKQQPRKKYERKNKKYEVLIKQITGPNYLVGRFATYEEIAKGLNDTHFFDFTISKTMINELCTPNKRTKCKGLKNVIINKNIE